MKMHSGLKREHVSFPPSEEATCLSWDSLESDTESAEQEEASQRSRAGRPEPASRTEKDGHPPPIEVNEEEEEELVDSLECAPAERQTTERSPTPFPTDAQDDRARHVDLWSRVTGATAPAGDPKLLQLDGFLDHRCPLVGSVANPATTRSPASPPSGPGSRQGLRSSYGSSEKAHPGPHLGPHLKGGYRYIDARLPCPVETPQVADAARPYRLHAQGSSVATETHLQFPTQPQHHTRASRDGPPSPGGPSPQRRSGYVEPGDPREGPSSGGPPQRRHGVFEERRRNEDIVERNRLTLGRTAPPCGSYLRTHAARREAHLPQPQVAGVGGDRKVQRPRRQKPAASGVEPTTPCDDADWPPCSCVPPQSKLDPPTPPAQPRPFPPFPAAPLSVSPHAAPTWLDKQDSQDGHLSLAWVATSQRPPVEGQGASRHIGSLPHQLVRPSPPHGPTDTLRTNLALPLPLPLLENTPGGEQRTTALRPSCIPLPSHVVLPPIGQGPEPHPVHRSISDSYLERKDQLTQRIPYKAYTLKDYMQLRHEVDLRGLGPDYTASKKLKMRRQKMYSHVIREQNKNMSRIPFLPARDQQDGSHSGFRKKALDYAKRIAKPPVKLKPQEHPSNDTAQPSHDPQSSEGTEVSSDQVSDELASFERLLQRHEEDKRAVASFRKASSH